MTSINEIWNNIQRIIPSLNTSAAGILRRITEVFGSVIDIVRLEILRSEQTIAEATKIARVTNQSYYIDQAYNYQEGDPLVVINQATQQLGYAVPDATKQIIKQASIGITSLGIFYINVATADSNNNIMRLSQAQLDAFREYYQNFIAMGAQCTVSSNDPAIFTAVNLYVRFYKTYNLDAIKASINTALHELQTVRRINSLLYINEVETYLSSLTGVRDAYFSDVAIQFNGESTFPQDGKVYLPSGYFNFDPELYNFSGIKTIFESV